MRAAFRENGQNVPSVEALPALVEDLSLVNLGHALKKLFVLGKRKIFLF